MNAPDPSNCTQTPARKQFTTRDETSLVKAGTTKIGKRPPYLTSRRTGEGDPAEQAEPQSVQFPPEPPTCWYPTESPPRPTEADRALARLEAWLAVDKSHDVNIYRESGYWTVNLVGNGLGGPRVFGYENPEVGKTTFYPAYAKEPGLGPTIHAAIDKAEKVGL